MTSEGFPTNALLGFTNMLVKLLTDYRPRGVAVCWDTKPVHRTAISGEYKSDRRPMPDLLREQFPHFRPIVEAFGYRNLEFEGWEADDVIATLATRADEADIATCVVSTDRDAFQLVSENVCLMMTPRGVADVHVYTPDTRRSAARRDAGQGAGPDRPQGRHLRLDPRHPGHRRQDGSAADAEVRLARERARARVRAVARAREGDRGARRPGARLEAARDDAARPRHRLRPGGARARAARPVAAEGDVPPIRVPRPAPARRPAGRGAACGRGARQLQARSSRGGKGQSSSCRRSSGSRSRTDASQSRPATRS